MADEQNLSVFDNYFERKGSILIIKNWFVSLKTKWKLKEKRKKALIVKKQNKASLIITKAIRNYAKYLLVVKWKQVYKILMENRYLNAVKIQTLARR